MNEVTELRNQVRTLKRIFGVTIVVFFLMVCGCGDSPFANYPKNAIDATTISDDFENNQLAAETKYTNLGAFFVTGNFHEYGDKIVDKDNEYHYDVITLDVGPWNKVVIFGLTREYIETLNKGDEVTFKVKFLTLQMIMDHPVFEVVE